MKLMNFTSLLVESAGQHNDSRMNMSLISTAVQQGAVVANHVEVIALLKDEEGKINGARMRDVFSKDEWNVRAKVSLPLLPVSLIAFHKTESCV